MPEANLHSEILHCNAIQHRAGQTEGAAMALRKKRVGLPLPATLPGTPTPPL
jgi:hypothetical protein